VIPGVHVRLVPLDRRHLDATLRWANDPDLMALLDRAWPVSAAEHEQWFEALSGRRDRFYLAIETVADDQHVGNVWLWDIDWRHRRAELRIVVGDLNATGRGLGAETIDLVSRFAFARLNLHKVFANVLATNLRARRSFEKAGFELEGTLKSDRWVGDKYVDVYVLGRRQ
jgi:RimJ/RimL family protein N-acetyltransferase